MGERGETERGGREGRERERWRRDRGKGEKV